MRKTWALIRRELLAYFSSPLAYVVMTAFLLVNGWVFVKLVQVLSATRESQFNPLAMLFGGVFFWFFMLFFTPAITMRLVAEERRSGTLEVLLTSPITEAQVVMSKFLAALLFFAFLWLPTGAYLLLLRSHSNLDWGPVLGGYASTLLLGALFLSVGLLTSTLVRNQIIAAVLSFAILIVLFSLGWLQEMFVNQGVRQALQYVSLWEHTDDFCRGIFDTRHVVYPLSLSCLFLFLATKALEAGKGR